ncbi:MAG: M48 family metallopeptidase [Nitrospina sp.]|jgi:predicted Zn-dependent protease|nr:M48 family metallopeptidase [Nitrospina sp.]
MQKYFLFIILTVLVITACATTPVSNRSAFILIPESQEISLGKQSYNQILKKEKESEDAQLNQVVRRVAQRIIAVSDMPKLDWEVKLIESDQKNAFALPGGKIAIYTGILSVAKNEAGLATVMSHEIAHVIARHGAQRMSQQMILQLGMIGAGLSMKNNTQRNIVLSALGVGVLYGFTLPFSRSHESEADQIGLIYMAKAGYDPNEALNFWQRFSQVKGGKGPPEWASTHPADATRMQGLRSYLSRAKYNYQNGKVKYGLGQTFNLPQQNKTPDKPKAIPGVSVETLNP